MTTILSGCGGGYDVFCAIPQYLKYIDSKKKIILLNLSFTSRKLLEDLTTKKQILKPNSDYFIINYKNITENINNHYFPEYYLSKELESRYIKYSESTINQIKNINILLNIKMFIKFI